MSENLIYIQLKTIEDLVKLVAASPVPFIQHTTVGDNHVYFVQSMLVLGRPLIYLFKSPEKIDKKYIVYNRFKDEITYSDKLDSDGQSVYVTILEVEKTNLFGASL